MARRAAAGDVLRGVARARGARRGSRTAGWATITTARGEIEARVLVTQRMTSARADGAHGPPDRAALPLGLRRARAGRPPTTSSRSSPTRTSQIQESKALTATSAPGRRSRGRRSATDGLALRRARGREGTPRDRPGVAERRDAAPTRTRSRPRRRGNARARRPSTPSRRASSPTPRSASAARRARSPASSGTSSPTTGSLHRHALRQHRPPRRVDLAPRRLRRARGAAARPGEPARRRRARPDAAVRRAVPRRASRAATSLGQGHPADPHRDAGRRSDPPSRRSGSSRG